MHFDDASIGAVTLVNSHGTFAFTKVDGKWTGLLGKKPIERLDQEKVKDMLRAYKSLSADDFGDGKSLAETGLDKPEAQATFQSKGDEPKTYGIWLGKISNGTDRWAKRAEDDAVFQITSYAADWLTADSSKYQSPLDGGAAGGGGPKKTKSDAGKKSAWAPRAQTALPFLQMRARREGAVSAARGGSLVPPTAAALPRPESRTHAAAATPPDRGLTTDGRARAKPPLGSPGTPVLRA